MSDPAFFCHELPAAGATTRLRDEEARHATAARRLKAGDVLWLFDGRGAVARARFQSLQDRGREVEVMIEERHQVAAAGAAIHLACAVPKGDRASVMLDMATQLGVTDFTPLLCEHSVVKPGDSSLERLRRVALEACKQSRRAWLPTIHAPAALDDVLAAPGAKWIAHPDGESANKLAQALREPLTILIGPEGGFTEAELALAASRGATRVALGANILRVETAAVMLVGLVALNAPVQTTQAS
jgi:16S rRNA (uracil1498-N3)-methyltransferase